MAFNFLIVDDSSVVRKVIIRTIGMTALDVNSIIEAENGQQALEKLKESWVDLIFLDINMPVMNGLQFMEALRADSTFCDTPVIIVSTEGSKERIERLNELGIKAYLRKPTSPEDLASAVNNVLLKEGQSHG